MPAPDEKPPDRAARALDALLTLAVFVFFTWVLRSHVASNDPFFFWLWGAITASCLTALFWLALQMFRVVLRGQIDAKNREQAIGAGPDRSLRE